MKIIYSIHTNYNPQGAAYNRVQMLSKGINLYGIKCKCITFKSHNFKHKILIKLQAIYFLIRYALLFTTLSSKDIFIIYGENTFLKYILKLPKRTKIIVERNEYSTYLIRDNIPIKSINNIKKFETLLSKCDGMIVCSNFLKNYYRKFTTSPITIIPLVVDTQKFITADYPPEKYIAYCGDFGGNKDGLPILLDAFAIVSSSFPEYKLYLIGDTSEDDSMKILKDYVNKLKLSSKIVFTGRISHDMMPQILSKASLLVLSRPANKQAEGGIPSKLAEYLATGRPTIITKVGELDKYFTDNKDLFFAIPGSVQDFAAKMQYVLSNYTQASKIGKQGAECIQQFDYKIWSEKLIKFLYSNVQK